MTAEEANAMTGVLETVTGRAGLAASSTEGVGTSPGQPAPYLNGTDVEMAAVAYAAWRERSVGLIRGPNCDVYLRARGWVRTSHGRWIGPYGNKRQQVRESAMHTEREMARREMEKTLLAVGMVVLTKGSRMLPYEVVEAVSVSAFRVAATISETK